MWIIPLLLVAFGAGALNNFLVPKLSTYVPSNKFTASFWGQSLVSGLIILVAVGISSAILGAIYKKPRIPGMAT